MKFEHNSGLVTVEVIKDSYNPEFSSRATTFILEYPRIIHSEFMTHRVLSRNASSSRAIPVVNIINQVLDKPAMPVRFGKNQAGMQDCGEYDLSESVKELWIESGKYIASAARVMKDMNAHKQVVNRLLEPWQFIKVCCTSTNWNNFLCLRNHKDADPTIQALAELMDQALKESTPVKLEYNHWHVPFVDTYVVDGNQIFKDEQGNEISLETALKISASCAAQTSYRKTDASLDKADDIFDKLIHSKPCHASPVEHACKPIIKQESIEKYFEIEGVTHVDKNMIPWSGNYHGFIQYRQLIEGNAEYY